MPQHSRANPLMDAGYKVRIRQGSNRLQSLARLVSAVEDVQVLMRRNSVYVFVILAGALAGERVSPVSTV